MTPRYGIHYPGPQFGKRRDNRFGRPAVEKIKDIFIYHLCPSNRSKTGCIFPDIYTKKAVTK